MRDGVRRLRTGALFAAALACLLLVLACSAAPGVAADGNAVASGANPEGEAELVAFRVLVFSKTTGFRHDSIPDGIQALHELGAAHGFAVDATEDASKSEDATLAEYAAVVFLSTTGDVLDEAQQSAFERYIRRGGGFVGVHAASDTEYDWPWYGGLVGTYFQSHPPVQEATILVEDAGHLSTQSLPGTWVRSDEWYDFRENPRLRPGLQVLATLDESTYWGGGMADDHPIAWFQVYEGGRAWYTAGGHTQESYAEPLFREHLLGGIQWAAGAPLAPPEGAIPLLDADEQASLGRWQQADGRPLAWPLAEGVLEVSVGMGDVRTTDAFGSFRLHLEYRLPASPADEPEQSRGNSGVYLQERYELQVLDSYGSELRDLDDGGALYGLKDADVNVSQPPGVWQSYDVEFHAAEWYDDQKVASAQATVRWNGVLVHNGVTLPESTPGGQPESPEAGSILLQDHGSPVQYRNIWLVPLDLAP